MTVPPAVGRDRASGAAPPIGEPTLQQRLLQSLQRRPDARALAFYEPDGGCTWLTRRVLLEHALITAGHLADAGRRADRGRGSGDVCLVVLPSRSFTAPVVLGALLRGEIPLLMAPPLRPGMDEWMSLLQHVLSKSRARTVICEKRVAVAAARQISPRRAKFLVVDDLLGGAAAPLPSIAATDTVLMQMTSGTTGAPRVCTWSHAAVLDTLEATSEAIALGPDDIILTWTPLYHDLGLVNNLLLSLVHGVPLVLQDPVAFIKKPAIWLQAMSRTGATISWSPNFGFAIATKKITATELEGVRLDHVRALWNGAERTHLQTVRAFEERFRRCGLHTDTIRTSYGGAENVGGATFSDPAGALVVEHVDRRKLRRDGVAEIVGEGETAPRGVSIVSVGRPRPGIEIDIVDRCGSRQPDGRVGEIAIRSVSAMDGYLRDAKATRRARRWNVLRMGDLGYRRGREVFWVGRISERITIRAIKLDPSDLDHILSSVEGLRAGIFAAFGIDDPEAGTQKLVIVVEQHGPASRSHEEIATEVKRRVFIGWGVEVSELLFVEPGTLVKTSSGKRRHGHVRRLYESGELPGVANPPL